MAQWLRSSQFPSCFTFAIITLILKMNLETIKTITGLLKSKMQFQRFLKKLWTNKFRYILKQFFQISVPPFDA